MMDRKETSPWLRLLGGFTIAATLALPAPILAQDDEEEDEDGDAREEITVTGSRIKRDEFNSAAPVSIITSERTQLAGLLEAGDILQNSTIASGQQINDSFSGFVTDGGPGANTISLRGLGAQRTLVLVNGKRWGPSGTRGSTNSVDLTAIPTSIVARYEILKDGASSVYGADAVAGVINVITKERVDGLQLNVQSRLPEDGGGEGYTADAIWGKVGDNWSFNIGGQYGKQNELVRNERKWAECDIRPRFTDQDGDGRIDNTDPQTGQPLCFGFLYGTEFFQGIRYEPSLSDPTDDTNPFWDPFWNGTLGIPFFTEAGTGPLENENQPFYRDDRSWAIDQIVSENDIYSVTSFADVDFSIADRTATAYTEFYWNRRETRYNGGYRQFFPVVPASNPYNPVGPFGVPALPVLPSYELQDPNGYIDVERFNAFVGLRGDISPTWTYDAYVGYSESDGQYRSDNWLDDRVTASINAVDDGNGNVVCADLVTFPDCVAPNLFGEAALLDGNLPAWREFVSKVTEGDTDYRSQQFNGYVTGDLFEMPAGEVGAVLGFEYRREEIDDHPDVEARNDNLWGRTAAGATVGEDTVREAYAELEIPLFENAVLAEQMTFNGSFRYTDYNSYGDDTTYRVALDWQVNEHFRIRATRGTSFRAPDLFEQFLDNETGFLTIIDPCTNYGNDFQPGDVVYDNCASEGLAPDFGGTNSSIRTITGGNQDLLAETSDSWTAGFVLTPGETGISVAVNWFDIQINNTVASPTIGFVINDCYTSNNFSSPFCDNIAPRDAQGNLTDVNASLLNVGFERSAGADIDILYEKEFSTFDFTIDGTATYIREQERDLLGELQDFRGKWGFPEWTFDVDFRADWRDWTFFYRVYWIGNQREEPVFDPGTMNLDRPVKTGTYTYNSIAARYRAADWEVIGTIGNLFDRDPPIVGDSVGSITANRIFNTLPGVGYDLFGRSFVLQASMFFGG